MPAPGVKINLGNGSLGQVSVSDDGVAGLILTGTTVEGKLQLNKPYQISSTRDLTTLGIDPETNPLADKEIKAFYAQAGDGAELHLLIVAAATTLAAMCDPANGSPLCKLIDSAGGRIRLVGVNKLPPAEYEADTTEGIDKDAITAAGKAQQAAESYAGKIRPFRVLLPAPAWTGDTTSLYKPAEGNYNRVAMVLASDTKIGEVYPAAIGMVLGRAAALEPQQCIGRIKSGVLASDGYFTNGSTYLEKSGMADALHDAGYIFFMSITAKNGCYLNGDPMAAPPTDDYNTLNLGRIIDKAAVLAYTTYITEIMDNVEVDDKGQLSVGACKNFEGMIENAVNSTMGSQISSFSAYVNPAQNILSTCQLTVECKLRPLGVIRNIVVNLSFDNPAL